MAKASSVASWNFEHFKSKGSTNAERLTPEIAVGIGSVTGFLAVRTHDQSYGMLFLSVAREHGSLANFCATTQTGYPK